MPPPPMPPQPSLPPPPPADERRSVRVVVRVRPLSDGEAAAGHRSVVEVDRPLARATLLAPGGGGGAGGGAGGADNERASGALLSDRDFSFDAVFDASSTQREVYEDTAMGVVNAVLQGYNGTIFAYGQTGTGKTFTMEGGVGGGGGGSGAAAANDEPSSSPADPLQQGIMPAAFDHIFSAIQASEGPTEYTVSVSYIEIYNEEIRDLLAPGGGKQKQQQRTPLQLRERADGQPFVKGLSSRPARSAAECRAALEAGRRWRATASTNMNQTSSRSHAVFTVEVEAEDAAESAAGGGGKGSSGGGGGEGSSGGGGSSRPASPSRRPATAAAAKRVSRKGKLNLVDLAGSERQDKTGARGERQREGIGINLSLSALGNVIMALSGGGGGVGGAVGGGGGSSGGGSKNSSSNGGGTGNHPPAATRRPHVPYRDSTLTRLLQDSLGGNARTVMVACVGPASGNRDETLSTLRYASRAKLIVNAPRVNEDPKDAALRRLREEIAALRAELERADDEIGGGAAGLGAGAGAGAGGSAASAGGTAIGTPPPSPPPRVALPEPLSAQQLDDMRRAVEASLKAEMALAAGGGGAGGGGPQSAALCKSGPPAKGAGGAATALSSSAPFVLTPEQLEQVRREAAARVEQERARVEQERLRAELLARRYERKRAQYGERLSAAAAAGAARRDAAEALRARLAELEGRVLRGEGGGGGAGRGGGGGGGGSKSGGGGLSLAEALRRKEAELARREAELARRRRDDAARASALAALEEAALADEGRYSSLAEESAAKGRKLAKLWRRFQQVDREAEEAWGDWGEEKGRWLSDLRRLEQQLALQDAVLAAFIPPEEARDVVRRAVWDDRREEWSLPRRRRPRGGGGLAGAAARRRRRRGGAAHEEAQEEEDEDEPADATCPAATSREEQEEDDLAGPPGGVWWYLFGGEEEVAGGEEEAAGEAAVAAEAAGAAAAEEGGQPSAAASRRGAAAVAPSAEKEEDEEGGDPSLAARVALLARLRAHGGVAGTPDCWRPRAWRRERRPTCALARRRAAAGDMSLRYRAENILAMGLDLQPERTAWEPRPGPLSPSAGWAAAVDGGGEEKDEGGGDSPDASSSSLARLQATLDAAFEEEGLVLLRQSEPHPAAVVAASVAAV